MQCSSTTVLFLLLSKPLSSVKLAKSQEIPWRKTKKRPLWNDIVDITVLLLLSTFAVQLVDYFPPLLRPLQPHYYSAQYDPHIKAKSREIEYNENGRNLCQALWRLLLCLSYSQNVSAIIVNFNFWLFLQWYSKWCGHHSCFYSCFWGFHDFAC